MLGGLRVRFALLILVAGCEAAPVAPATSSDPPPNESAAPVAERAGPQLQFVPAPPGELAAVVRDFMVEARASNRTPLVYVGATWCEPCRYFHQAAEAGELDDQLPRLALLELDLDEDKDRIDAAGYGSRMIPLFAVPGADGRGTDRRIEGSIHGPGSPAQILPRLRAILSDPAP